MKRWIKRLFIASILMILLGLGTIVGIYYHLKSDLPDVATIQDIKLQVPMKVFSIDGELLSQFGEKRRIPLKRDEVPEQLVNAFLATEDSRYYQHFGIDPIGIVRAAIVYASTGKAKQGASTITQQVARNFFLTREKTFVRKIKEIFIAIQIEQILSKDEILMLYLNKISLGHRSFGIGAAAQVYYGKSVDELTLPEMAVIAGLPKAPSSNNPIYSPTNAKARRNVVLMRMLDEKHITQAEYDEAREAPITGKYHGAEITLSAHYVAELAHKKLLQMYGKDRAYNNGYNVYTTINKKSQLAANQAALTNLHNYDKRHGYRGAIDVLWEAPSDNWTTEAILKKLKKEPSFADLQLAVVIEVNEQTVKVLSKKGKEIEQEISWDGLKWARPYISDSKQGRAPKLASDIVAVGELIWIRTVNEVLELSQYPDASTAFVSLNPQDGAITSMVGGFSFVQSKFNRVTQAERQVGSNIKPFLYSAALDNGYTLATLVNDAPINQWTGSAAWRPKNSPAIYDGPIRLRRALGQSKNVVSVRLVQDLGVDTVIEQLGKYGFDKEKIPKNNTIALGSASLSPLKLATGYAIIANGGYQVEPYVIERIEDAYGSVIYQATPKIVCKGCQDLYKQQAEDKKINNKYQHIDKNLCAISPISEDQIAQSVISPETAFLTRELLYSAIWGGGSWQHKTGWNGTGWRAGRALQRHDIGGKTGTTNDSKDAWFSGYVGNVVATSWVGFDNFNRNLGKASINKNLGKEQVSGGEFGGRTALPAWIEFMQKTALTTPAVKKERPNSISTARIDRETGLLTRQTDYTSLFEYFRSGTMPTEYIEPAETYEENFFDGNNNETGSTSSADNELF
ncbi:penicillin-binding protein 1A [Psychromonas sp. Urea-02u-13]|uniref:penicillin-binding protein 1A n=1 Tax=Psychromonas sp. Urea-02u-13 TaxID=2058326 RepID=UPI000C325D9D|nr:PBP1A family penicillin-binding protein [Psychromonas sp. Urea-02u-13]PKG40733.1 penicillin-sensitive transpeptidase [Psychromonas sp. Urea-02u-13]